MTNREHIRRRVDALSLLALVWTIPGFVVATMAPDNLALICIALAVFAGGLCFTLIVMVRRIPCPDCNRPLGSIASTVAQKGFRFGKDCPHCGVSFDTEMPFKRQS